jgi:hypothetical protein
MREEDDTPIPWSDELPPRIDEGEYDAVVLSAKKVNRFGLTTVEFRFRIVTLESAFDARLVGYCGLGPTKHPRFAHTRRWPPGSGRSAPSPAEARPA